MSSWLNSNSKEREKEKEKEKEKDRKANILMVVGSVLRWFIPFIHLMHLLIERTRSGKNVS